MSEAAAAAAELTSARKRHNIDGFVKILTYRILLAVVRISKEVDKRGLFNHTRHHCRSQ